MPNTKKSREHLDKCPFCGSQAFVAVVMPSIFWTAACRNATCGVGWFNQFSTRAEAIQHWNQRVVHDTVPVNAQEVSEYVQCGWRQAWVMWDMDNGHAWGKKDAGKGYMWVFSTRKAALLHRKRQHAKLHSARLSMPFKISGRGNNQ